MRLGNAVTPPLVVALTTAVTWRGAFLVRGAVSLVWVLIWAWYFRVDSRQHRGISQAEIAQLPAPKAAASRRVTPWGPLMRQMAPVTFVYFSYGWTLPFLGTMGLMLAGIAAAFLMRPGRPFGADGKIAAPLGVRRLA